MNRKILLVGLISLFLIGCTTVDSNVIKGWSEEKIQRSLSSPYHTKPEQILQQDHRIMRQELVSRHTEWSETAKTKIIKGEVFIGMTKTQALACRGIPSDINRTVTANIIHEQWVYENLGVSTYLYFDNDKLTAWQD
jgi:hypothetical protein